MQREVCCRNQPPLHVEKSLPMFLIILFKNSLSSKYCKHMDVKMYYKLTWTGINIFWKVSFQLRPDRVAASNWFPDMNVETKHGVMMWISLWSQSSQWTRSQKLPGITADMFCLMMGHHMEGVGFSWQSPSFLLCGATTHHPDTVRVPPVLCVSKQGLQKLKLRQWDVRLTVVRTRFTKTALKCFAVFMHVFFTLLPRKALCTTSHHISFTCTITHQ